MPHDIIDNSEIKLLEVLKQKLAVAKKAQIAVGFLFLSGFKELRKEIYELDKLEILAGSRTNRQTIEAMLLAEKWEKAVADLLEQKKYLNEEQRQKILDEEFKGFLGSLSYLKSSKENAEFLAWFLEKLRERKIEIRVYCKEPLHAKLYLFEYKDKKYGEGEAIVGSSNFSLAGFNLNTELNVRVLGDDNFTVLSQWFQSRWLESEKTDFTALAQQAIEKSWAFNQTITPFRVYLRILYEMFSHKAQEPAIDFNAGLYDFQKDAVIDAYRRLKNFDGVFVSDVPGLGKTYIGSALLSHLETEGKRAIVVVPPKLKEWWQEKLGEFGCSKAKVFSSGKLNEVLENPKDLQREVVLIDECHHFRNPERDRYRDMAKICEKKQVIMLSATPQNLNIWDIYWQVKLFTPYEVNHNFRIYPVELKKYFKMCEEGQANIDDLISQIFIRRTRLDIKEYYPQEKIVFPKRRGPFRIDYSIDEVYEAGLYEKLRSLISGLTFARYDLSRYAKREKFTRDELQRLEVAWGNLPNLVRINFNRRLESSVQAFRDTVAKNLARYKVFSEFLERKNKIILGDWNNLEGLTEEEIDDFEFTEDNFYDGENFRTEKLKEDLTKDIGVLTEMLEGVKHITPQEDDKLQKLVEILEKPDLQNKKILLFSSFESTVRYLFENLKDKFGKLDFICGGGDVAGKVKRFAPEANDAVIKEGEEIKILLSTEILSEGLNLQDGQVVINYDLHWNPVRLIQRIGRIDRLGSEYEEIFLYNFFPETAAEKEINIEKRVRQRIDDIIKNFGYDQKTVSFDEATARKKLFEIYNENSAALEEEEARGSIAKYFEMQFGKIRKELPEEYRQAITLPHMVNIACQNERKGIAVFCRAGDYNRLKLANLKGDIIEADEWKILNLLECKPEKRSEPFSQDHFEVIEKVKDIFESEANQREQDKSRFVGALKADFEKWLNWLKRGEPQIVKNKFDELLDFVLDKQLNYGQEKFLRALIRNYKKKFGLNKKEILRKIQDQIYPELKDALPFKPPVIKKKYAKVIIAEEFR